MLRVWGPTRCTSATLPVAAVVTRWPSAATRHGVRCAVRPPAPSRRSLIAQASTLPNIREVDAEGLEVEISNRNRPLVIDFYATWCGPCLMLAKELEKVAETMGDGVRILKVDTDRNPDIASQLQIQGLPTMIFVSTDPSKTALRTEGMLDAATIVEILTTDLDAPAPQQA